MTPYPKVRELKVRRAAYAAKTKLSFAFKLIFQLFKVPLGPPLATSISTTPVETFTPPG